MKILWSVVLTLVVVVVLFIAFIYSGWYNVSAMHEDTGFTRWVMRTTMRNSVNTHVKNIAIPNLNDPARIREGISHYKAMCEPCHGGPGKEETALAKGLSPDAPDGERMGKFISPEKAFWITKNGIKMTGMPAWGKTHSDDKIWDIVAAVKVLPSMSPSQYDSIKPENEAEENQGEQNEH